MAVLKSNNLCHVNQISPSVFSSIVLVLFSSVHRALVVEPWSSTGFLTQCGFFFFKSEISDMTTAKSSTAFHDSTRLPSKTSGHCFETNAEYQLENADTATSSTTVKNLNTRNLPVHIRSYRKVRTYREKMNRLHQLKNQYPVDLFNSFVARLRSANAQSRYHIRYMITRFPSWYF